MSGKLQIVIAALVIIMLAYIVNMVRRKKVDLRYALLWIVVSVVVLILDAFPIILISVTQLLGITLPTNMLFFAGLIILIILTFSQTVIISKLAADTKRLAQEVALLKKECESNDK